MTTLPNPPKIDIPEEIILGRLLKPFEQFTPDQLNQLRMMLYSPLFLRLLAAIEQSRPSANCWGAGSENRDALSNERSNARLGEMRGWEMHLKALYAIFELKKEREPVTENFQSSDTEEIGKSIS